MLSHDRALMGLSDGGAHVGTICDASFPTTLLSWWARDRPGDRFTVLPFDAPVKFRAVGAGQDAMVGPWKANGGAHPGDTDPLRYSGTGGGAAQQLSAEECAALVAMGYMQDCSALGGGDAPEAPEAPEAP